MGPPASAASGAAALSQSQPNTPIFSRAFDFLRWLVPVTNHFPRVYRHTVTQRLLAAALDFQERILEANELRGERRRERLDAADAALSRVRVYLRLSHSWKWLNDGQYEHAGRMVAELGRLLGGWKKSSA